MSTSAHSTSPPATPVPLDPAFQASLLDAVGEAVIATDVAGTVVYWNKSAERLYGWSAAEAIGRQVVDVVPAEMSRERGAEIMAALGRGEPWEGEFLVRRRDGITFPAYVVDSPILDATGALVGVVGVSTDISARKAAESRVQSQTDVAETLLRIGRLVTRELDAQRIVQTVTDEATALTGAQFGAFFYNVVDARGESYMLYTISGAPREAFERFPMPRNTPIFAPTFGGERVVRYDDVTTAPEYGTMAPHHGMPPGHLPVRSYLAVPVTSSDGSVIGGLFFGHERPGVFTEAHERSVTGVAAWASVAMDNARLHEAERHARAAADAALAEAERASRAKSDFLATMSHELRTPLNAIAGYTELLRLGVHGAVTPSQDEALDRVSRSQRHLLSLINDLLNFARAEAGHVDMRLRVVAAHDVLQDLEALFAPQMQAKRIRYEYAPVAADVTVIADADKLRQVMLNLISNAVKFTPDGGVVTVGAAAEGDAVRVWVRDTGPGIPADKHQVIFDPFVQLDRNLTSSHQGTGLGLSISRELARAMGGELGVESEPGRGAAFTVTLRRAQEGESLAAHELRE